MDARPTYLRERLSLMMFLQFFIWGGWWVPVSTYAMEGLRFTPDDMTWIVSTIALGAMVSPLFGLIADRFLPTQWVLGGLHVIGGLCLIIAGFQESFGWMFIVLLVNTICFMPTLALANSLSFRNLDDPNKFPRIAMFGTIGWIAAGLPSLFFWLAGAEVPWERKPYFFFLAGVVGLIQGAYCCLALPHTPPKRGGEGGTDVFGLGALKLLKERSFLIFAVCAFLVVIPINYYFAGCNPMLSQHEWPAPTTVMTLGQVTEVLVMFSMAGFIAALGLKNILALGMLVWALRYVLFATGTFPLVLLGVIIHGFGYVFVYVGSYIYVDKCAPRHLRASAQSLIAFLMLGVGMLVGTKAAGWTLAEFPAVVNSIEATKVTAEGSEQNTNGKTFLCSIPTTTAKSAARKSEMPA
jgi:nucleoside transporter